MRGLRISQLASAAVLASGAAAMAAPNMTFFQFSADPDGTSAPAEFVYSPVTGLSTGPGATGDGTLFAPGIFGVITGGLSGIPVIPPGLGPGPNYQIAGDLSLALTGFAPVGSATVGATTITQPLGTGAFAVYYHNPSDGLDHTNDLVLLTGTTTGALLTEKDTASNASVLSDPVVYTGGILLPELIAAGLDPVGGSFSFVMTGLNGAYQRVPVGDFLRLDGFAADGGGTFDAPRVPEPTVALGAAALILPWLGSRRSRKA